MTNAAVLNPLSMGRDFDADVNSVLGTVPPLGEEVLKMGTTLLAMKFSGGVIMCADGKTAYPRTNANEYAQKLSQVSDRIFIARAGLASGTQLLAMMCKDYLHQHKMELSSSGMDVQQVSVQAAASLLKFICYQNKDFFSGCAFLVGGVDNVLGSQVFSINGAAITEHDFAMRGSGSTYVQAMGEQNYRPDMSEDEAIDFAVNLITQATFHDSSSGGLIRYVIMQQGKPNKHGVVPPSALKRRETTNILL